MRKTEEAGALRPADLDLSADVVAAFLRAHPDFFSKHSDLLRHLEAPKRHRGNGVVDFQHYMVERLQRDIDGMTRERHDLIVTARDNLLNQTRVHAAVLALLEARDLAGLLQSITTDLAVVLDLDVATLVVESNGDNIPHVHGSGIRVVPQGTTERWLEGRKIRLRDHTDGDPALYGEGAGLVKSEALLKLEISRLAPVGLLAFGSRDAAMFHPGQGTELVGFLARTVELRLRAELDLPPQR
jgi:uncharacterized protein